MSAVEGLPFAEDKKEYILSTLDPILEEMVSDLLSEMPTTPMDFMIQWLNKRAGKAAAFSEHVSVSQKNAMLKKELGSLQGSLHEASTAAVSVENVEDEEEEEDDEDDEPPPGWLKSEESQQKTRTSVSAEAYGEWNAKKAFTPPDYPKSDEQKQRLKEGCVSKRWLTNHYDQPSLEMLVIFLMQIICFFDPLTLEGDLEQELHVFSPRREGHAVGPGRHEGVQG